MPMNETARLAMPLLQAAQAQKHVTVNEALMRLDGLVNPVLRSVTTQDPPAQVIDGECWGCRTARPAGGADRSARSPSAATADGFSPRPRPGCGRSSRIRA